MFIGHGDGTWKNGSRGTGTGQGRKHFGVMIVSTDSGIIKISIVQSRCLCRHRALFPMKTNPDKNDAYGTILRTVLPLIIVFRNGSFADTT